MNDGLAACVFVAALAAACSSSGAKADAFAPPIDAPFAAESDCFDGIDNNGDGKIDCDDPTCATTAVCESAIPQGWTGFDSVYDGVASGAPADCSALYATSVAAGSAAFAASPATCTACNCGAPAAGTCASSGGAATLPTVTWARLGVACERTVSSNAAVCAAGQSCLPRPSAPFVSGVCVHQSGDLACPTGSVFSVQHVFYATVDDTRGCTACACGAPAAMVCAPSGGTASGSASPDGATTYCCTP